MAKTANEKKLDELSAAHDGRVAHIEVGAKLFVFRAPTLDEFEDYQAKSRKATAKGEPTGPANREIAMKTLVHPDSVDDLSAAFARYPVLPGRIGDALCDLAGSDIEISVKKG